MAGGILLCGAVFNLTAALVPLLVQTLIDQGRDYAFFCISIFAVLMIIQCAAGYGDMRLSWQFEKSIKTHIRQDLFHFVLNTYPWVSNIRKPAQYISIFNNDIAQAEEYLELCVNTARYAIALVMYFLILGRLVGPGFTVLLGVVFGVILGFQYFKKTDSKKAKALEARESYLKKLTQLLNGRFLFGNLTRSGFGRFHHQLSAEEQKASLMYEKSLTGASTLNEGMMSGLRFSIICFLAVFLMENRVTLGAALAAWQYVNYILEVMAVFMSGFIETKGKRGAWKRVDQLFKAGTDQRSMADPPVILEMKHPCVIYRQKNGQEEKRLDFPALTVHVGEKYWIRGNNGCGKSTLLKLICQEIRLSGGEIKWNGTDFYQYNLEEQVGLLKEEPVLFPTDFKANVTLFGSYPLLEKRCTRNNPVLKVRFRQLQACKDCTALSGGEKQLVALFCLWNQGKSLWLLDECFSAMDTVLLREVLREILKDHDRTVLLVLHQWGPENLKEVRGDETVSGIFREIFLSGMHSV